MPCFSWLDKADEIAILSEAGLENDWSRTGLSGSEWSPEVPRSMANKRQRIAPILLPADYVWLICCNRGGSSIRQKTYQYITAWIPEQRVVGRSIGGLADALNAC
jgi:hypothetical protein